MVLLGGQVFVERSGRLVLAALREELLIDGVRACVAGCCPETVRGLRS